MPVIVDKGLELLYKYAPLLKAFGPGVGAAVAVLVLWALAAADIQRGLDLYERDVAANEQMAEDFARRTDDLKRRTDAMVAHSAASVNLLTGPAPATSYYGTLQSHYEAK